MEDVESSRDVGCFFPPATSALRIAYRAALGNDLQLGKNVKCAISVNNQIVFINRLRQAGSGNHLISTHRTEEAALVFLQQFSSRKRLLLGNNEVLTERKSSSREV